MRQNRVDVGSLAVDDLTCAEVVDAAARLAAGPRSTPARAYALHVGGLNHRMNQLFVDEMRAADLVYADGGSVVLLAKLAGARRIERASTTDVGWDILRAFAREHGRPARLALIGGPAGLADRAGAVLEAAGVGKVVLASDGYAEDWAHVLARLDDNPVDICIVGMGAPREMLWVRSWYELLPKALILTCGGWFGFLTGDEKRAPRLLRRPGLEWVARLAQSPRRLAVRYAQGLLASGLVAVEILRDGRG